MTFLSLSHTVWTAGRPINGDHASNNADPQASLRLLLSVLTVGSTGEQVAVLCPHNGSPAGPLVCPSVKLGRSQTALPNRLEALGRPMLASDSSQQAAGAERSQEGPSPHMRVFHPTLSHLASGKCLLSLVLSTLAVQLSSEEAQEKSWCV